jgi:hypothetical protein
LLSVLMVVGIATLPHYMVRVLQAIPSKYLMLQFGFVTIFIVSMVLYWSLQVPKTAQVALGLMRAFLSIAVGSTVAPISLFGLQSLSVAIRAKTTIDIALTTPLRETTESGATVTIVAMIAAYFAFREFYSVKTYEYEHGISTDI